MANLHMPPEVEADLVALAEDSTRDAQAVYEEVLQRGIAASRKAALDSRLTLAHDEILAGKFYTAAESLAMLDEEE